MPLRAPNNNCLSKCSRKSRSNLHSFTVVRCSDGFQMLFIRSLSSFVGEENFWPAGDATPGLSRRVAKAIGGAAAFEVRPAVPGG